MSAPSAPAPRPDLRSRRGGRPAPRRFVVFAGMPRTGSTSLFHLLTEHPGIAAAHRKEVGYFLYNFHRGPQWYLDAFRRGGDDRVAIDVTPEYFFSGEAMERMRRFELPLKVVIGVRDPVEVARSLHGEYSRRLYGVPGLDRFVGEFSHAKNGVETRFSFAGGVTMRMIDAYRSAFGPDLLLFDYSYWRARPLELLGGLERFMGIASHFGADNFHNLFLNAGERRNVRWLSHLLGHEGIAAALARSVPSGLLLRLARAFYRLSATGAAPDPAPLEVGEAADLDLPYQLRRDRERVRELFLSRPVVLGDGGSV